MTLLAIDWTPEAVIALCALIVSILSVIFTWFTLKYQRLHNYKTVRPIGIIVAGDYENKIFIRLDNSGIGPLIIKKVVVKNKTLEASTVIDIIPTDLSKRIVWTDFAAALEQKTIPAGQQLNLIVWTPNNYQDDNHGRISQDRTDLRRALKDVTVTLSYTDVYERNVFKDERSLDWFGRHFNQ
jgi:hypothetical protein